MSTTSPVAPRILWRPKTVEKYAAEHNPYRPGSLDYHQWRSAFYTDQAERSGRFARWFLLGVVLMCAAGMAIDIALGNWPLAVFMAVLVVVNLIQFATVVKR